MLLSMEANNSKRDSLPFQYPQIMIIVRAQSDRVVFMADRFLPAAGVRESIVVYYINFVTLGK